MDRVFDRAFEFIISGPNAPEKGHGTNRFDSGGQTYWGIARNFWPNWEGWKIIDTQIQAIGRPKTIWESPQLMEAVRSFYWRHFWAGQGLSQVADIFPALAIECFDHGVNSGSAGRLLQKCLNTMNRRATLWPDLAVDGSIGPRTLSAVKEAIKVRGKQKLYSRLNLYQAHFYFGLMEGNPEKYEEFEGWFNRIDIDYKPLEEGL